MLAELWDIYDKNRIKTGRVVERGGVIADGGYHLVVHIGIFNTGGELLIQQRQPFKETWPDLWDFSAAGSAVSGDSSQTAAQRELFEELGLAVDFGALRPHFTVNFEHGFDDFYLLDLDVDLHSLRLQPEEVRAVRWATRDEVVALIERGRFIPYHRSLIDLCFAMRGRLGARSD